MNSNFNAIPISILNRLSKLTSRMEKNNGMKIDKIYPRYVNAFLKPSLDTRVFSNLK